ncbi:hypothetical protein K431DRAFT_230852 [Polychaeton citri CBS 116435]|uniref:Rhodopsin domain-containing protein n=1 Tax=Polychaeton citri CBS 116435 TaxID=1314669 RepID=A0A9P4Q5N8_9PEZI|nr:hypothetical protein K431DRAFT_230852 [Polychaeton citri CBS 116435]
MTTEQTSPAFQRLSKKNHGPLIIIVTYVLLICSCLAVSIKVWTRLSTARKLITTDWAMIAGMIFAVGQAVALTLSVNDGLGRHVDELTVTQVESVGKGYYASSILAIVALAAAKASVTLLIVSIRPARSVMLSCYYLLGLVALWMVAGVMALAFQCELPKPWALGPETCVHQFGLQVTLGAINVVTDVAVIVLAFSMMRTVQVSSSRKWTVVALFGLRIATPPFTVCALITYHTYYYSSPQDRTWHAVTPTIWNQVMLNTSIITACIPSIKRFFADVQSGLMGVTISEQYEMTHSGGQATQTLSSTGSGFRGKIMSRLSVLSSNARGSSQNSSSKSGKVQTDSSTRSGQYGNLAHVKGGMMLEQVQETESVKGLTDNVIHQKIDYEIEFEEQSEGRTSSQGRSKQDVSSTSR